MNSSKNAFEELEEINEITITSENSEIFNTPNNAQIVYVYEEQVDGDLTYDIPSTSNNNKRSRTYKQYYRKEWEECQDFKGWLQEVPNQPTRAYCLYCDRTLHAHRLSLLKHICTLKHTKAAHFHVTSQQSDIQDQNNSNPLEINITSNLTDTLEEKTDNKEDYSIEVNMAEEDSPNSQAVASLEDESDDILQPPAKITKKFRVNMSPNNTSSPLTTHVLDTSKGIPVSGLQVSLYKLIEGRWTMLSESLTNPDGRITNIIDKGCFITGRYKLHFDVYRYFEMHSVESLYPFVEVVFDVKSPHEHYHIPLLINPYGYSTYKGS